MTDRCRVERYTGPGDSWGDEGEKAWALHLDELPCKTWVDETDTRTEIDGRIDVHLSRRMLVVPKGTDVTPDDRIAFVNDRRGLPLWDGPMKIDAVIPRPDHVRLDVTRIT